MISLDEKRQGTRLLIAVLGFLVIGASATVAIMTPLFFVLVYLFGGLEDVIYTWHHLAGAPPRHRTGFLFLLAFGLVVVISIVMAFYIWNKIFVRSGYISKVTITRWGEGYLPVVGGYWKPFMYIGVSWGCMWMMYRSYQDRVYPFAIFFAIGLLIFVRAGLRQLAEWWRARNKS